MGGLCVFSIASLRTVLQTHHFANVHWRSARQNARADTANKATRNQRAIVGRRGLDNVANDTNDDAPGDRHLPGPPVGDKARERGADKRAEL